jgi:RHS repeat-associated protein
MLRSRFWLEFDVSDLVGDWYHGEANEGFLVDYLGQGCFSFYSTEFPNEDYWPQLVIEYEPVRRVGVYANLPEPAYAYFDDIYVKECSERYIWLGNLLLSASYSEDERYYYYHDILGSVVGCGDVSGKRYARVEYDEFGNRVYRMGEALRRELYFKGIFLYTGHEWDAETGLYYLGARYYNPFLGRFITEDPVAGLASLPQSLNPYAYCLNDPLNYVDERGEFIGILIGAAVSALIFGTHEYWRGVENPQFDWEAALFGAIFGTGAGLLVATGGTSYIGAAIAIIGGRGLENVLEGRAWYEDMVFGVGISIDKTSVIAGVRMEREYYTFPVYDIPGLSTRDVTEIEVIRKIIEDIQKEGVVDPSGVRIKTGGLIPSLFFMIYKEVHGVTPTHYSIYIRSDVLSERYLKIYGKQSRLRLIRHEFQHIHQHRKIPYFIPKYIHESIRRGYWWNRYEVEARAAEEAFIEYLKKRVP